MAITWILVRGIKESSRWNFVMVILKITIVVAFLIVGAFYVKPENWTAHGGFASRSLAAALT